ncbi:hypothetical protein ACFLU6_03890 [Acidobacteriota bacterium]
MRKTMRSILVISAGLCFSLVVATVGQAQIFQFNFDPGVASHLGDEVISVSCNQTIIFGISSVLVNGEPVSTWLPDGPTQLRFITPPGGIGSYADVTFILNGFPYVVSRAYQYGDKAQELSVQAYYPHVLPLNLNDPNLFLLVSGGSFSDDLTVKIGDIPQTLNHIGKLGATVIVQNITTPGTYDLELSSRDRTLVLPDAVEFEVGVHGMLYGAIPNSGLAGLGSVPIYLMGEGINSTWVMDYEMNTCPKSFPYLQQIMFEEVISPRAGYIDNPVLQDDNEYRFGYPLQILSDVICGLEGPSGPVVTIHVDVGLRPGTDEIRVWVTPQNQNLLDGAFISLIIGSDGRTVQPASDDILEHPMIENPDIESATALLNEGEECSAFGVTAFFGILFVDELGNEHVMVLRGSDAYYPATEYFENGDYIFPDCPR